MTLGFDHGGTRAPSRSARRTRTLLLAGGLAITPLGGATIVAQQASDPALSDDAAQRLRDADAAVKQLSAVSPNRLSATQRLQGPDQGLSRLLEEVPAYLPNYYHSALTAPGFRTPRAAPQADLPQEAPQGILAPDLAPDSAVDSANGSTIDSGPDAAASAARAGGRQPGLPCRGTNVYDRGGIPRLIPQREADRDPAGCEGSFQPSGATAPATNAFFASLGTNGRTCATCHQPPSGMSVSVANIEARYKATRGTDAIFAGVDGANCPSNLPPNTGDGQAFRAAHSLLLQRGVFRIFLPVPAGAEYTTEVVLDLGRVHSTRHRDHPARKGSPGRLAAGAVGLGSAVSAAITNHRALGPAEAKVMALGGALLLALAVLAVAAPHLLTIPLAAVALWFSMTLLVRAWRLRLSRPLPRA